MLKFKSRSLFILL